MIAGVIAASWFIVGLLGTLSAPSVTGAQSVDIARFKGKLERCTVTGLAEEILCGRYEVFENRRERTGRTISLNLVVLPAKGASAASDAVVYLAGGGVLPATEYAGYFAREHAALRSQRDIVLVDQRGTGESNPLRCAPPAAQAGDAAAAEAAYIASLGRCRADLETRADLRFYSTSLAMDDLDDIRDWLGYSHLSLYGMSYGTKAAQVYLKQHPSRVRVIVMHGVVPLSNSMWGDTPRLGQESLDRVMRLCAAQAECRDAFPRLREEFNELLIRLTAAPVTVSVARPAGGDPVDITVSAPAVRELTYTALSSAAGVQSLPLMLHRAYLNDFQPLARRLLPGRGGGVPRGVFLSIACAEAVALVNVATISADTANTFLGDGGVRRLLRSCDVWPKAPLPAGFWEPAASAVPVLLLVGSLDNITPIRYAEAVASHLTNSRVVTLPDRSHNDLDPCVSSIITDALETASPREAAVGCLKTGGGIRFATAR